MQETACPGSLASRGIPITPTPRTGIYAVTKPFPKSGPKSLPNQIVSFPGVCPRVSKTLKNHSWSFPRSWGSPAPAVACDPRVKRFWNDESIVFLQDQRSKPDGLSQLFSLRSVSSGKQQVLHGFTGEGSTKKDTSRLDFQARPRQMSKVTHRVKKAFLCWVLNRVRRKGPHVQAS